MFFLLLCLGLYGLVATGTPIDEFGWLWLVAAGWFFGFLDGRVTFGKLLGSKNGNDHEKPHPDSTMPPDELPVTPIQG